MALLYRIWDAPTVLFLHPGRTEGKSYQAEAAA